MTLSLEKLLPSHMGDFGFMTPRSPSPCVLIFAKPNSLEGGTLGLSYQLHPSFSRVPNPNLRTAVVLTLEPAFSRETSVSDIDSCFTRSHRRPRSLAHFWITLLPCTAFCS